MKFLSLDSPFIKIMEKVANLMWLNFLTLVLCIPIVTAGAAFTALHYMSLKIVRNEDTYITRGYFKSFKQNFRQATIIWLIFLFIAAMIAGDIYILLTTKTQFHSILQGATLLVSVLVIFTATFVFPLQAKFENTIKNTIKNAFIISILHFPKTLTMIVMNILPWLLLVSFFDMLPFVILFGFSVPAWAAALLYNKFFQQMEDRILASTLPEQSDEDDEERIFKDELDNGIADN